MSDVRLGLRLSWIAATVVTIATVIAPYVLSAGQIARVTPRCERKAVSGRECFLCGMTTGFVDIAHGHFSAALAANRASLPLYGGFTFNGLGLPIALLRRHRKKATTC